MAYYALLDHNNIVVEVITGKDEDEGDENWELFYGNFRKQACKRTSFHMSGGVHATGKEPFRKNFAGIGYSYDPVRDAFIPPKPFNSWVLDEQTCLWKAPVDMPEDAGTGDPPKRYQWDEVTTSWAEISQPE